MIKLLFVEDDLVVLEDLITIVDWEKEGFCVYTAVNGLQGLKNYEELHPELVITDVKMPFMDGLEMMQSIRRINPSVPFMILSSYEDFSYVQDALRQGARDYIRKTSITRELLLEKVSMLRAEWESAAEDTLSVLKGKLQELVDGKREDTSRMEEMAGWFPPEKVLLPFVQYAESALNETFPGDSTVFRALEARFLAPHSEVVTAALAEIHAHFSDPELSNSVLAVRVGMSERRLAERFKAETGHTINDYITRTRMKTAKKLLRGQKLIYEIAEMTGYSTPQYFGSVFKQHTGMTPNDYRARYGR